MRGTWIRKPTGQITVVFVHGILSNGDDCWKHKNSTYWPDLLKDEQEFQSLGIYVYSYETGIFSGTYSLNDVVTDFKERLLNLDNVIVDQHQLVFVCHSMGGIVARKFLVERLNDLLERHVKVGLLLVASPSLGSRYLDWLTKIASTITSHSQAKALRFTKDNIWLNDLDNQFMNMKESERLNIHGKELIEDKPIKLTKYFGLKKQVVEPFSGARYFGEHHKIPNSDHFSIAKPANKGADQHLQLLVFLRKFGGSGKSSDIIATSTNTLSLNTTDSTITASDATAELEQLRAELGKVYAEKLGAICAMRGRGDSDAAWEMLSTELASLANSQIPKPVQARYYYHAARWAQSDDKPAMLYRSYYETALRLNPDLDDRTYLAFGAMSESGIEAVISLLYPLDSEAVAINLFGYLLESGRSADVGEFMDKLATPITNEIRRLHALCLLAAGDADGAWQAFEPALSDNEDNALFQLTAGYIAFWQAIPAKTHSIKKLFPQFFAPGMFSLNDQQIQRIHDALNYVENAINLTNSSISGTLRQTAVSAYFTICVNLPEKHSEAIEKAKVIIAEHPVSGNPLTANSILYLMRLDVDHDWSYIINALSITCKKPYPILWEIDLLGELLVRTGKNEQAWQHLNQFESSFLTANESIRWFDLSIHCLSPLGRLSELEKQIADLSDDSAELLRIKASFWLHRDEITKALEITNNLVASTGELFDYVNLIWLYRQQRMWQEVIDFSNRCLNHFDHAPAEIVAALVQAWMSLDSPSPTDALAVLKKYKQVFERDGRANEYLRWCMVARIDKCQFPEAWAASERLWKECPSEQLLVERAWLQISLADVPRALQLLKDGIEQGFESPQILILLAHHSLTLDREEAFMWAQRAVERFPSDPKLRMQAMSIGFNSGHSDWAGMQVAVLRQDYSDCNLFQEIKINTLLEWLREGQVRATANWQQFLDGLLPIHLWLDSRRQSLGAEFYWRWHDNCKKPLREHVPFPIAYGGRSVESFDDWKNNALCMDYSACLMAHQLKLFPFLDTNFDVIHIPPSLLGLIQREIHQLAEEQVDRIEQAENLLNRLTELNFTLLSAPKLEAGDFDGLQAQDRLEWALAEQQDLLIVTDLFATELFESGSIPLALEALRISYADVFTALQNRGELALDNSPLKSAFRHTADSSNIERLRDGTKLLVDRPFLEYLIQLNGLEAANRIFKLHCIDDIRDQLRADIESHRYRQNIKKSLESLQAELKKLLSKGKLKLLALCPAERHIEQPLSNELTELFLGEDINCPVWIDDRQLSSYQQLSPQAPIIGVHDVLLVLHSRKAITDGKLLECFRQLIRAGIGCRLPPVTYLMKELMQAKIDSNAGALIENSHLTNLRLTVALSLGSKSILSKTPLRQDLQPEIQDYQFQLHRLVDTVMVAIWTNAQLDRQQRVAMADWLYGHFLPQSGRPVFWNAYTDNRIQGLAIEHSFRMSLPWQFIETSRAISEYYQWFFSRIEPAWRNQPSLRDTALNRFADLIISQLKDFSQQKIETELAELFVRPLTFLPEDVRGQLLTHPELEPHLRNYFITGTYIPLLDLFFADPEWTKLSEDCITQGAIQKTQKGRRVTLEFKRGNGISDSITVSGQAANGTDITVNMLSPYSRLEHSVASRRVAWLDDMIQIGLLNAEDDLRYRICLQSEDFRPVIEELKNKCQHSGNVFFSRAFIILGIQNIQRADFVEILPSCTDILLSVSPIETSMQWLFTGCANELKKRIVTLAALPYGTPLDLATAVEQALADKLISTDELQAIVSDVGKSSLNPVVLQNLLALCLRLPETFAESPTETLIQTLLSLNPAPETNQAFDLYIELLRLIWQHFQFTPAFMNCTYEQRVTWAYVYADRMLDSILQQRSDNPNYWLVASKNISKILKTLTAQINPFDDVNNEIDVILPSAASRWRTVVCGTLGILAQNIDSLVNVKQAIIDTVNPLLEAYYTFDDKKLKGFDFLEPTDYPNNLKNSVIGNQGWALAVKLIAQLDGQPAPSEIQPTFFWLNAIKEGDDKSVISYLSILARYPIPAELVEPLVSLIENLIDEPFNQTNKQLFLAQSAILGRLTCDRALDLRKHLIKCAIEGLAKDLSLWLVIPDLTIQLYRFDDHPQRINTFIATLGEIARVLPIDTRDFSDFYASIRRIEAYVPPNVLSELWYTLEISI